MRLMRKEVVVSCLVLITWAGDIPAQEESTGRAAQLNQSLARYDQDDAAASIHRPVTADVPLDEAQAPNAVITPQTQLPPAQPKPAGETTVSERLRAIRSRGVDTEIGKPFMVANPRALGAGTLKAVPKRRLPNPDEPVAKEVAQPTPAIGAEPTLAKVPTPATQPVPHPASSVLTGPISQRTVVGVTRPTEPAETKPSESGTLLTNHAPSLSFETYGPKRIIIGREAEYQVRLVNTGTQEAKNVAISVQLPPWAEVLVSSATSGTPHSEQDLNRNTMVRWDLDFLAGGAAKTLTLTVIPRDSRPFDLAVGWSYAPDQSMAQIEVQEPKIELAIEGPEEVQYGETQTYNIAVSNPGTGDAENVVLSLVPMMAQQQVAGTRNLGTIKAGDRKTIDIELTAHQAGRLRVRAAAHADGGLRAEMDQEVVVRRANLDVVIVGPPRNFAATVASYKVRVENTGDAVAEEAVAIASLPAGATYVSSTAGGTFDSQRGQLEWRVGTLRPGASRELEMRCELHSPGDNRVDISCRAERDINVAKSVVTTVEALADLVLHVDDPKGAIAVGQHADYDIRITNRGTKAAENIQIVGYFSDGVEPISIRNGRGDVGTGKVTLDSIPSIGPGQELVFRIVARAHAAGNHVFRAELECTLPETKLAAEEWTKYYAPDGGTEVRQASLPQTPAATLQITPQ